MKRSLKLRGVAGAMLLAAALGATTVPAVAYAAEGEPDVAITREVAIAVTLEHGEGSVPLAGTNVTVREATEGEEAISSGVANAEGVVTLTVTGPDTSYIVDAEWPGAAGELESPMSRAEFRLGSNDPVALRLWGPAATVSGRVSATVGAEAVADLSGSTVVLLSGDAAVQRIAVGADGSFASAPVPANTAAAYRVRFEPTAGHELAAEQPENAAFALPSAPEGVATHELERSFALLAKTTTPDPDPESTTPPPAPGVILGGELIAPGTARANLGAALGGITEGQLAALLAGVNNTPGDSVVITNGHNQVLGLARALSASQAFQMGTVVGAATSGMPGVAIGPTQFVAVDLESAMLAVQSSRTTLLNQQLTEQLAATQRHNKTLSLLNDALSGVKTFIAAPSESTFDAAAAAIRAAAVEHEFLTVPEPARAVQAGRLATVLQNMINDTANTQQTDMLRLQSLSGTRNEAFDMMSDFMKKMQSERSNIVGNMRSTPVSLGAVEWNAGAVTGSFDLSGVHAGEHHLILDFEGTGVTTVSEATVSAVTEGGLPDDESPAGEQPENEGSEAAAKTDVSALAVSGGTLAVAPVAAGATLLLLGATAVAAAVLRQRRGRLIR